MSQNTEVYTISDDEILESMRKELERRGAMRPDPSAGLEGGARAPSRTKVRYAQPPASGSRALWASTLSLFFCGAGQAYNGQGKLGLLLFLTEGLFVAANWCLFNLWGEVQELCEIFGVTDLQVFVSTAAIDYLAVFLALAAVYQAYRQAERDTGAFAGRDNPILSGMASLLMPGWGQLVNGQPGKAVSFLFFFLSGIYTAALLLFTPFLRLLNEVSSWRALSQQLGAAALAVLAVGGVVWILSVYDAILVAGFRRRMG